MSDVALTKFSHSHLLVNMTGSLSTYNYKSTNRNRVDAEPSASSNRDMNGGEASSVSSRDAFPVMFYLFMYIKFLPKV